MKYWEFISVFRKYNDQLSYSLLSDRWNTPYGEWFRNYDQLVRNQDRDKLDASVPEQLVLEVAERVGDCQMFYLDCGWLRLHSQSSDDLKLNILEAVKMFGRQAIEEAMEYGSCKVKT